MDQPSAMNGGIQGEPSPHAAEAAAPGKAAGPSLPDLIPARMVNEYVYCPRLAYLEWVQGEWADNIETQEGKFAHRRAVFRPRPH